MEQKGLEALLKEIADQYWKENGEPMFLSDLPPALGKAGIVDYRKLLEGKSLKAFIKDSAETGGYRLVEHATQSAKVALAPMDAKFEFSTPPAEEVVKKPTQTRKSSNKALALLEILATLPESELAQISIPVSALVKLAK